jgi:DNA-binding transcriptional ArsR family regulator
MAGRSKYIKLEAMLNVNSFVATDVFFALSDNTRLSIIDKLCTATQLSATQLSHNANVTRQNITKHLQILEKAGLIVSNKKGREVIYTLEPDNIESAQQFLNNISMGWDKAIERLRQSLE